MTPVAPPAACGVYAVLWPAHRPARGRAARLALPRWAAPLVFALLFARCYAIGSSAHAAPCAPGASAEALAESGLAGYREALALPEGAPRTRALERAVQCFLLARKSSRSGGEKLDHPLGLCYEKLGRTAAAYAALDAFRRVVPESQRLPGVTAQIDGKLAALRPRVGLVSVRAPAGTALSIDGQDIGQAPIDHLVAVPPGPHQVLVTAPGGSVETLTLVGIAGQVTPLQLAPAATGPVASPGRPLRIGAAVSLGLGLALVGAGGALWGLADHPTCDAPGGAVSCPRLLPPAPLGIGLAAGGVAMLGVSLTLYLRARHAR